MLTSRKMTEETEAIRALYERAFPENERRELGTLLKDTTGVSDFLAFYDEERFVGFAALLTDRDISHIIYFAVEEALRGEGYGRRILDQISALKRGKRVIADLELPDGRHEQRTRRMAFYKRNGFEETPVRYSWRGEDYVILSRGGQITAAEFERFWNDITEKEPGFAKY